MSLPNPTMSFSPFAILTADEVNDLVENDQALAAGSGLNNNAVTTAKIADSNITSAKLAQAFVKGKRQIDGVNSDFSGFLIQMGSVNTANFGGGGDLNVAVVFPTPYATGTLPIVTCSPQHNQGAIDQVYSSIVGRSNTSVTMRAHVTVVGTPNPVTFNWIAIGQP